MKKTMSLSPYFDSGEDFLPPAPPMSGEAYPAPPPPLPPNKPSRHLESFAPIQDPAPSALSSRLMFGQRKLSPGKYLVAGLTWGIGRTEVLDNGDQYDEKILINHEAYDPLAKLYFNLLRLKGQSRHFRLEDKASEECKLADAYIKEHALSFWPHELFLEVYRKLVCEREAHTNSRTPMNLLVPHTVTCSEFAGHTILTDGFGVMEINDFVQVTSNVGVYVVFKTNAPWFRILVELNSSNSIDDYDRLTKLAWNLYTSWHERLSEKAAALGDFRFVNRFTTRNVRWLHMSEHYSSVYGLYDREVWIPWEIQAEEFKEAKKAAQARIEQRRMVGRRGTDFDMV